MPHTIVGIDLGAHAVKFVMVEAGFRQSRILGSFAEPVADGELPFAERQGQALRQGLTRLPDDATLFVALPGEQLAVRLLDLPFTDPRKVDQVVGYELEGQIVHALSDVVFDHALLKTPGNDGASVLAVAAKTDDVAVFVADLGGLGVDPRALYAGPVVYQSLFVDDQREEGTLPACRALIDIGHQRTNVCVLQGSETFLARTVLRGGAALTATIARAYQCDAVRATEIKHHYGFVSSARRPAEGEVARQLDAISREALAPLLREIRQTLASARARTRTPVETVLLTGGTAALTGLAEYLEEELEVPVSVWSGADNVTVPPLEASPPTEVETRFALASAIAWAGARGRKEIDLRRGPFVYRASFSILRQRAVHLGALAAALFISIAVDTGIALSRLGKERDRLQAQLKSATQELFGEPRLDGRQVATLLKRSFKDEMAPIPKATAYDLLDEISRKVPAREQIKLDITEIDIRPKKVFIKGTVDSAGAVDEMVTKLKEIEWFDEITKGPISEVSGGAKSFTLTIASRYP
jgi:general secretion pathway protein L